MNVQKEYLNKKALVTFYKSKIITIKKLKELMQCSVRTIYTRLKAWEAISSYNMNSSIRLLMLLTSIQMAYGITMVFVSPGMAI